MMVMAPGGFERFFAELETLTPPDDPPAPADMAALAARYDLVIRPDWIPELSARYGVTIRGEGGR